MTSRTEVPIEDPARWAKQLASHFGRKNPVHDEGDGQRIDFPDGSCLLRPLEDRLVLEIRADEPESVTRLQHVIGSHFERFAAKHEIRVTWPEG